MINLEEVGAISYPGVTDVGAQPNCLMHPTGCNKSCTPPPPPPPGATSQSSPVAVAIGRPSVATHQQLQIKQGLYSQK